ncbi:MAG TPA: zinc-dependent metalloprotease [Vicinamibacterales bacterium]
MTRLLRSAIIAIAPCALVAFSSPSAAQEPPPAPPAEQAPAAPQAEQRAAPTPGSPRPYDRVITKEAKSDPGVFTVHRIGDRLYYEIPASQLNKEFLWVSQIARTTVGAGQGGQAVGSRVVKWERRNNRVFLRSVSYDIVADRNLPIAQAVQAANNETILMAFNVETVGKDDAPVIDVTRLFTTEVPEFSARGRVRSRAFDASRSFVERAVSFPENIEVEATHTYSTGVELQGPQPAAANPNGARPGSASIVMHYSMVKLPENPMVPRLFDERVGYFTVQQYDYGRDEHRAQRRRYITKWRLEKKDSSAALSEPIKPIVFYIDPATPTKWIPWIKRGIEAWQPAFEEAGFKNAILAKDAPTKEQDPDWSPEDARYSVIRWLPSTTENASGPHISDPRTGEILESDIQFHHNVMNLVRDWYFVQVGPLDPRASKLPLPDDLMGRLLEYVTTHEVGHTLGFQHNMKASSEYPAENIRNAEWVKKMGHTPSIMDYSRFNYVAQPEDHIDPADLIPRIGPYDKWATMWGYKPIAGTKTADDEKKTLDEWARAQDATPWLRFSTVDSAGSDPGELTEAVGDADAVRSTTMGVKNLARVADMLLSATTRPGEPYDDLEETYGRLLGQWVLEMNHVAAVVGGVTSQQKVSNQDGLRFVPLPRERQQAAVQFLSANAFTTPMFVVKPEILRRIEPNGTLERIRTSQLRVLTNVMSEPRIARLVEQEALDGASAYKPSEFFTDVRRAIWSEIDATAVQVDPYRRNLQRAYLDVMNDKINGRQASASESRSLARNELRTLDGLVRTALMRTTDRTTRAHLQDVRDQIGRILDPKFAPTAAPLVPVLIPTGVDGEAGCWLDYAIRISKESGVRNQESGLGQP